MDRIAAIRIAKELLIVAESLDRGGNLAAAQRAEGMAREMMGRTAYGNGAYGVVPTPPPGTTQPYGATPPAAGATQPPAAAQAPTMPASWKNSEMLMNNWYAGTHRSAQEIGNDIVAIRQKIIDLEQQKLQMITTGQHPGVNGGPQAYLALINREKGLLAQDQTADPSAAALPPKQFPGDEIPATEENINSKIEVFREKLRDLAFQRSTASNLQDPSGNLARQYLPEGERDIWALGESRRVAPLPRIPYGR